VIEARLALPQTPLQRSLKVVRPSSSRDVLPCAAPPRFREHPDRPPLAALPLTIGLLRALPLALLALPALSSTSAPLFERAFEGCKRLRGDKLGEVDFEEDEAGARGEMGEVLAAAAKIVVHWNGRREGG
jgi:hypothetical protein